MLARPRATSRVCCAAGGIGARSAINRPKNARRARAELEEDAMAGLQLAPSVHGASLPSLRLSQPRFTPRMMVSERHNQAYKETIKLFDPLPTWADMPDIPLNSPWKARRRPSHSHIGRAAVHAGGVPIYHRRIGGVGVLGGRLDLQAPLQPSNAQDIPLAELPRTRHFLNTDGLPKRIYPMLGQAFKESLPNWRALRVADAFVVKYDAANGQKALAKHRDGSVLSFNIALNERCEYVGGGTWFEGLGQSIPIDQGHVCCHASGVLHGGHPITEGIRYILVAFVIVEGYQNWAMRYMNSVWDY